MYEKEKAMKRKIKIKISVSAPRLIVDPHAAQCVQRFTALRVLHAFHNRLGAVPRAESGTRESENIYEIRYNVKGHE